MPLESGLELHHLSISSRMTESPSYRYVPFKSSPGKITLYRQDSVKLVALSPYAHKQFVIDITAVVILGESWPWP